MFETFINFVRSSLVTHLQFAGIVCVIATGAAAVVYCAAVFAVHLEFVQLGHRHVVSGVQPVNAPRFAAADAPARHVDDAHALRRESGGENKQLVKKVCRCAPVSSCKRHHMSCWQPRSLRRESRKMVSHGSKEVVMRGQGP